MQKHLPISKGIVSMSNDMISSKFMSTLSEAKMMLLGVSRIEKNNSSEKLEASFYPSELKKIVTDPTHIYRDLKVIAKSLPGRTMILEDNKKGNYSSFSVIPNCKYEDGVFTITFNDELKEHIFNLKGKGFAQLEIDTMLKFKSISAFRIYELLKKDMYLFNDSSDEYLEVCYRLSELKFIIGLCNIDNPLVKKELSQMKDNINWDYLFEKLPDKERKYKNPGDLVKWVILPAQEEIENKSDIKFDYKLEKEGKSYKTITFFVTPNSKNVNITNNVVGKKIIREDNYQFRIPNDIEEYKEIYEKYVGHNGILDEDDITLLLTQAHGDKKLIEKAILTADQHEHLNNYIGWIIDYIKHDGYENIETVYGNSEAAKVVSDKDDADATKAWELFKEKPDYNEFLSYVKETNGLTEDMMILTCTDSEKVNMYLEFKKQPKFSVKEEPKPQYKQFAHKNEGYTDLEKELLSNYQKPEPQFKQFEHQGYEYEDWEKDLLNN